MLTNHMFFSSFLHNIYILEGTHLLRLFNMELSNNLKKGVNETSSLAFQFKDDDELFQALCSLEHFNESMSYIKAMTRKID